MKIKTILVLAVAAFCSMSCDKKTNDPKGVDFAGSYNGYTLANCNYFQNMISPPPRGVHSPSPMHRRV